MALFIKIKIYGSLDALYFKWFKEEKHLINIQIKV